MRTPSQTHHDRPIAELLRRIDGQLLPQPWRQLGCGNDAGVLHHPNHPALAVKV
jgi:hypothetical protein